MEARFDRIHGDSIVDLLKADDAQVTSLLENLTEKNQAPQSVRDRLLVRLCNTLTIQRLAEEEVLYPALRPADEKLVFGFLLVGLGISMGIGKVRDTAPARGLREASLTRLLVMVWRNLTEREKILLPFAKAHLSGTQLVWLGDGYQQRKARLRSVADAGRAPRPVGLANKPTGVRHPISLALWRKRRARDDAHP